MKDHYTNEEFSFLEEFKSRYETLKRVGEKSIFNICRVFKAAEKEKREDNPLSSIEIIRETPDAIYLKYLGIDLYVRVLYNIEKEIGYIEWGIYGERNGSIEHEKIHTYQYDCKGNIDKDYTIVDYSYVLIPQAFKNIFDSIKSRDLVVK